jgi:hypothetical protein
MHLELSPCNFFVSVTICFRILNIFVALEIGSRRLLHFNVTEHSTSEWTLQQLREALPDDQDYKFLLHDRHKTFSATLDETVKSWGIHVLRSPVRMPTANAHCERLIGSIRRECLDYLIPLNASHLRIVLWDQAFLIEPNRLDLFPSQLLQSSSISHVAAKPMA